MFRILVPLYATVRWPAAVLKSGICSVFMFRVCRVWTLERFLNLAVRYLGARPFMHLYAKIESLYCNCSRIGSQFKSRSRGVTWSNFLEFVIILQAKCWIDRSLLTFFDVVFNQTEEQYSILLKTKDFISSSSVSLSKLFWICLFKKDCKGTMTLCLWYGDHRSDEGRVELPDPWLIMKSSVPFPKSICWGLLVVCKAFVWFPVT